MFLNRYEMRVYIFCKLGVFSEDGFEREHVLPVLG